MNIAESIVAGRDQPDARQVHALGQPPPAEQPQPEEGGLQEEGRQPLHRQRPAEHVADVARVGRPVHPELELLHEAGDDPDGDVDQQQRAEEARQAPVVVVAAPVPCRLQDRDEEGQPDRHGDEQEVIDARRRELPARKVVGHPWAASKYGREPIRAILTPRGVSGPHPPRANRRRPPAYSNWLAVPALPLDLVRHHSPLRRCEGTFHPSRVMVAHPPPP